MQNNHFYSQFSFERNLLTQILNENESSSVYRKIDMKGSGYRQTDNL